MPEHRTHSKAPRTLKATLAENMRKTREHLAEHPSPPGVHLVNGQRYPKSSVGRVARRWSRHAAEQVGIRCKDALAAMLTVCHTEAMQRLQLQVKENVQVSALWIAPAIARGIYVLAHGAGVGMDHPFMERMARGLEAAGIATLRYQFPYMERGSRRPDPPAICHATVRAAIAHAHRLAPHLDLFAGGKSFGGRMTSQAHALGGLPGIRGLIFLGFPLHAAGKPATTRAAHLFDIDTPLLFLQGTRDELARLDLLELLIEQLGKRATLVRIEHADHSFHVSARTGRTDDQVAEQLLTHMVQWMDALNL